jgi:hypothetical protein
MSKVNIYEYINNINKNKINTNPISNTNNNTNTNNNHIIGGNIKNNKNDFLSKFNENEKNIIKKFLKEIIPNNNKINSSTGNIHDFNWEYNLLKCKVQKYYKKSKCKDTINLDEFEKIINEQNSDDTDNISIDSDSDSDSDSDNCKNLDFCYKDLEYRKEINMDTSNVVSNNNNINVPEKYNNINKFNIVYVEDNFENYYKILENSSINFDNSIDFNKLNKHGTNNSVIEKILSDKKLLNKYFEEILKYIKSYSYIEFNYFQLKVIYEIINIPNGYYHISDYVRSISKNIMSNDIEYFYSFYNLKTKKIFDEPYNSDLIYKKYLKSLSESDKLEKFNKNNIYNGENKQIQELKLNISKNEEYILKKYQLTIKCITRLNYKLSAKFGVTTTCMYTTYGKNDTTFNGPVILYNIFEIINLLRIIYRIVPVSY